VRLTPVPHDRVWGTTETAPWFANPEGHRIGEVWFDVPPECPLLIKFLFTSADLSVQVHPDDRDGKRGKTEMWHVLRAEPGARVAIGLKREVSQEELRAACISGAVVHLLQWWPAQVGDTFFVPAGTVHALGAGLVVCEIQQNSDVTYRLFDYGRGRELHLDAGLEVAHLKPFDGRASLPLENKYFRVGLEDASDHDRIAVCLSGPQSGEATCVPSRTEMRGIEGELLLASAPDFHCFHE